MRKTRSTVVITIAMIGISGTSARANAKLSERISSIGLRLKIACDRALGTQFSSVDPIDHFLTLRKIERKRHFRKNEVLKPARHVYRLFLASSPKDASQKSYVTWYFSKYLPVQREKISSESLARALSFHGIRVLPGEAPRNALERVSRANRERILRHHQYDHRREMLAAEIIVDSIQFRADHTTSSPDFRDAADLDLISARRLGELGLREGLNSSYFGHKIIGGNDQVYFYLEPIVPPAYPVTFTKDSRYGDYSIGTSMPYARDHAWLSASMMWPHDLVRYAETNHPQLAKELTNFPSRRFLAHAGEREDIVPFQSELIRIAQTLHELDFTLTDFEHVFRTVALAYLDEVRTKDVAEFQEILDGLWNRTATAKFVDLIYKRMGFSGMYGVELKFPTAVPANRLELTRKR